MAIICDIETIPQAREILEKRMPEEIRNPIMPPEISNPDEPEWKAPEYGLPGLRKKVEECNAAYEGERAENLAERPALEKLRARHAEAAAKVKDAEDRQAAWTAAKKKDFADKAAAARTKWDLGMKEKRWKFIEDAALDARLGHAKLLGLRDTITDLTRIFVWEPDKLKVKAIRAWFGKLTKHETATAREDIRMFRERPLLVLDFKDEKNALAAFLATYGDGMNEAVKERPLGAVNSPCCVTYYGNYFDFPFIYQRAWILGAPLIPQFRRGRYWDETRMRDLHDVWTFGDRQARSGGLEGMASTLGWNGAKTADAASFHEWYEKDPVEGVVYLIGDLDMTEFCGRKTGLISP